MHIFNVFVKDSLFGVLLLLFVACTPRTGKQVAQSPNHPVEPEQWDNMGKPTTGDNEDMLNVFNTDDIVVHADDASDPDSLPRYNTSHTFEYDLLHTKLDIRFDWAKRHVLGIATLTLKPYFYTTDRIHLDAKNFEIQSITFDGRSEPLKYEYDGEQIRVYLGRPFSRKEEIKLRIQYIAKPDERSNIGGSAAITSDKGLYFINPDGSTQKPRQIWTQGETESNSCWFPTNDKPNERCTQEMYITVEDKFKTLSNGVLVSTQKNPDGTRTDYWKMDKPHAPYLFMIGVGEYAVVKDRWRNIELEYWVEPKYEQYAKDIFPYTPEMLEFFSEKLNYPYPWQKYAQIIVRDFVSGAMENTTAVIFGDFIQQTRRELLDNHLTNEKIVAHEMFHHWFGDLVTTESWANLTLNEGFANYSEYLWLEHKHGADLADYHLLNEQQGYFTSAVNGGHPLIHFGYRHREDMFDAHSYNKGGCVLHMLREIVGEEAFWASLHHYLKKHEYSDVEAHELRLAFEDVTGQDLSWFWNQWFFGAGHPVLDISTAWDASTRTASLTVRQKQEGQQVARVFNLPVALDIYDASGKSRRENIRITKREQTFTFPCESRPALINFDATKTLLCEKNEKRTVEEWMFAFRHGKTFRDRWDALDALERIEAPEVAQLAAEGLKDKFFAIRARCVKLADETNPAVLAVIEKMAAEDPHPEPRTQAIALLGETGDKKYVPLLQKSLGKHVAFSVLGAVLEALSKLDRNIIADMSKELEDDESPAVVITLAELYAQAPKSEKLEWFDKHEPHMDQMSAFEFFAHYQTFLVNLGDAASLKMGIEKWKNIATNFDNSLWRRFAATKAIADTRNYYREKGAAADAVKLTNIISEIKMKETDPTLSLYYDMF